MDTRRKLRDRAWIREPGPRVIPRAGKREGLQPRTRIHALSLKACIRSCMGRAYVHGSWCTCVHPFVCLRRRAFPGVRVCGRLSSCVLLCACASHAYTWACVKSLRACRQVHDWILESGEITRPGLQERRDNSTESGETMQPDPQDCRDELDPILGSSKTM